MGRYEPNAVEAKWKERWASSGIYETDVENAERPFYNLLMFPYPSAEGLLNSIGMRVNSSRTKVQSEAKSLSTSTRNI